jgi:indole-3-glycerol phosphate synthase
VNVRDLDTLCIDRRTAMTTLRAARGAGFSPLIGLSGISTPSDARRFWSEGVDAILVGTAVARASRRAEFIASLRRASLRSSR